MLASSSTGPERLALFTLIVAAGIGAQWIAALLRLPPLILLLAIGIVLGPVTGVLSADATNGDFTRPLISIAVAVILFEGGLTLRFDEARIAGSALWRLIVSGLVLGFALVTVLGIVLADLSLATASMIGAILVVTGPTVILPMLRHARIALRPATLLRWEGIVNDPLGALLAVFVFQVAVADPAVEDVWTLLPSLILRALGGSAIGALVAVGLAQALRNNLLSESLKSPAILAAVLVVYTAAEALGEENGLLAVTVMGLVLANVREPSIADIRHFKEQVSVLLVSILFVVLSARLRFEDLEALAGAPLLLVIAVMFVVRPLVVWSATAGSSIPANERVLLGWVAPRGVVAAAVAGASAPRLLAAGYEDAHLLVPIVFGVIASTVVLQGFTLAPLARRLGLGAKRGSGILIVGASTWALELARALQKAGAFAIVTDTRYPRVSRARREGVESYYGDVLSEDAALELPLERVSWVLAATDDDNYNALVCTHFARDLERDVVLQLTPEATTSRQELGHRMFGRTPWGERGTYRRIAAAFWVRQQFKVTKLGEEYKLDDLRARHPDATILFQVVDERVEPVEADSQPPAGASVVYLEGSIPHPA